MIAKAAQPGEIVSPLSAGGGFTRTGIGTIVDMDSLEVEVDVGESYINRVEPGMPVVATLNAYPQWQIPGHVIAIIPAADRGKATVTVRIALEERDDRIVPEMGVRVSFLEEAPAPGAEAPPSGALVPADASVSRAGNDVVYVVQGVDGPHEGAPNYLAVRGPVLPSDDGSNLTQGRLLAAFAAWTSS